jgi:hypothetical protein
VPGTWVRVREMINITSRAFELLAAHHLRRSCDTVPRSTFCRASCYRWGDRMRRLEADGHVTRFVTRTLYHVVILGGRAETVASPGG